MFATCSQCSENSKGKIRKEIHFIKKYGILDQIHRQEKKKKIFLLIAWKGKIMVVH